MGSVYEVIAEAPQPIHEVGPCADILRLVYLLDLPLIELTPIHHVVKDIVFDCILTVNWTIYGNEAKNGFFGRHYILGWFLCLRNNRCLARMATDESNNSVEDL
jgi:hypothetical protein